MITVLYIDDEAVHRDITKRFLEKNGEFQVDTRASAREALAGDLNLQYDAIVSDYQMPGMDGIEFLRKIRITGNMVPFILFTGKGREQVVIQALNEGADFYLHKGGEPHALYTELAHKIRTAVSRRNAERGLQETGKRYQELFNHMNNGVVVFRGTDDGTDFVIIDFNHAAETIEQIPKAEVIGRRITEVFPGVRKFGLLDVLSRVWRTGQAEHHPVSFYEDNRITGWRENFVYRLPSGEVVAVYSDITAQKKAEIEKHMSEERYRLLADAAEDLIYIIDKDDQVAFVNRYGLDLLKMTPDEVIGKPRKSLFPELEAERQYRNIRHVLVTGQSLRIESRVPMPAKESWQDTQLVPLREADGTITAVMGISRDITGRKRMENALVESKEKFRTYFENSPVGVFVINSTGQYIDANPSACTLTGYSRGELLTISIPDLVPAQTRAGLGTRLEELRATGRMYRELPLQRKDGTIIVVSLSAVRLPDGSSIAFCSNIAQRKHDEDVLTLTQRFYSIADRDEEIQPLMDEIAREIREYTRCECVGIRLLDTGGNIPYVTYLGFEPAFFQRESPLNIRTDECMCIYVIRGDAPKDLPVISPNGSFFCNGTTKFLATVPEEEKGKTRNVCNQIGFESVALVPIKRGDEILGLIHIADRHEDMVPLNTVGILEECSQVLGSIIQRMMVKTALLENEEKYRTLVERVNDGIYIYQNDHFIFVNEKVCEITGYSRNESLSMPFLDLVHPDDKERLVDIIQKRRDGKDAPSQYEVRIIRKNGTVRDIELSVSTIHYNGVVAALGCARDVTDRKRQEEADRFRNLLLATQMETSPEAILIVDGDGRIASYNQKFIQLFSIPQDLVAGQIDEPVLQHVTSHLADPEAFLSRVRYLYDHKEEKSFEELLLNDGRILERISSPMLGESGMYYGRVWYFRDITRRKRAEEALRESEEKYRTLAERVNDAVYIYQGDHFLFVNNKVAEITGYSKEELSLLRFLDLIHPDDRKRMRDIAEKRARNEAVPDRYDCRIVSKDGKVRNLDITISTIHYNGQIAALGSARDVTERRILESEIRESLERYYLILQNAHDGILVNEFTPEGPGKFLEVNDSACRILGVTREELRQCNLMDFGDPELKTKYPDMIHTMLTEHRISFEAAFHTRDHTMKSVEVSSSLFELQHKPAILSVVRDITGKRRAEQALIHANKKLNLLTSITRHDIKNQLLSLNAYFALSRESLDDPAKTLEFIENEEGITRTIERQILFTREYENLGVNAPVWQNAGHSIRQAAGELDITGIELQMREMDRVEIMADSLLQKVFYNLIDNSLRHGGEGMTRIRFTFEEAPDKLIILCIDDGAGIPDDEKDLIFSRGYGKNTGFGLFFIREILAITEISITENGRPGKGARFEIVVPKGEFRFTTGQE